MFFFNCCLAAAWLSRAITEGGSLTHLMLITAFLHVWPKGHGEPRNEVGSLSPAKCQVGLGTFQFWLQRLNPLGHSPWIMGLILFNWHGLCRKFTLTVQAWVVFLNLFPCSLNPKIIKSKNYKNFDESCSLINMKYIVLEKPNYGNKAYKISKINLFHIEKSIKSFL